jgi:ElaB/YqjD/DUF883 family membrane-anchored ribosome-binding protein
MAQEPSTSSAPKSPRKKASTPTAPEVGTVTNSSPRPKASKSTVAKVKDTASGFVQEAANAARHAANEGKDKANEALDTFAKVIDNAAEMVEEKVGPTYGAYARKAATGVSDLSKTIQSKDVDALIEDTRDFVRKSPMVAIGAAAAIGFVLTRIAKLGSGKSDDV